MFVKESNRASKEQKAYNGCLDSKTPMKDVGDCDKPRLAVKQALIRGFPNGETQLWLCRVIHI